jgi:hypothetical protein
MEYKRLTPLRFKSGGQAEPIGHFEALFYILTTRESIPLKPQDQKKPSYWTVTCFLIPAHFESA